jgi:hypothetical protein
VIAAGEKQYCNWRDEEKQNLRQSGHDLMPADGRLGPCDRDHSRIDNFRVLVFVVALGAVA